MSAKFLSLFTALAICSTVSSAQYGGGTGGTNPMTGAPYPTRSYGSKAPIVAAAVGGAAAAGILFWRLHHRATLIGCVSGGDNTLISEKDNKTYRLTSKSVDLKPGERVEVSGKPSGKSGDLSLNVRQLRREFGSCKPEVGIALPGFAGGTNTKPEDVVEQIIARVNNHIITSSEYRRSQEQVKQEAQQQNAPAQEAEREKDVLRDLIDQQLLLQKGEDMSISADADLVKRLDEFRKQMNLESMEDLEKAAQAQGVSYEEFKQNLRTNIITQQVIQRQVGSHITISQEEIKKFYQDHKSEMMQPEQVRLSEILVSTAPKPVPKTDSAKLADQGRAQSLSEAEPKANQLLEEIHKGAKFDEVAEKNSDGPSAAQGGDLGFFKRGTLAKELEDVTFAMKPGDISNVIRTRQGFVILKITEHPQAGLPPLKQVEPKIQDAIYYDKLQPALRVFLTKLREDAYIDIRQGYVDNAASPKETRPIYTTASAKGAKELKRKKKLLLF